MRMQRLQTSYAPGDQGFYREKVMGGWGPLLNEGEKIYDNVRNFLQTGFYQKYDLSLTGGSEKFQVYASANYSKNEGIIPNDYLDRMGLLLKGTFQPFKTLTVTVSANVSENTSRDFGSSRAESVGVSGMESVYRWPINSDITNYEWVSGYPRYLHYNDERKYNSPISPLYARHNDYGKTKRMRNMLSGSVNWQPVKNLDITGRISYDVSHNMTDSYQVPRWDDSVILTVLSQPKALDESATQAEKDQYAAELAAYNKYMSDYANTLYLSDKDIDENMKKEDLDKLGVYTASSGRSQLLTAGAMATYKIKLPNDFSVDLLGGTELKMQEGFSMSNTGRDFIIPGTYSLENTNPNYLYTDDRTATHSQKRTFGYFGEIRGDYKGIASLSVTSRWDWSSTIITNPYYYPSVTAGLLFSELFDISNDVFNYGKLRGNYAVVGKDAQPYLYDRRYKQFATYPDNGYGIDPGLSSADRNLMPELSYSWEIGADLRFFNNRTRLDMAYYSVRVDNQIVQVRVSPASGYILQTRNEGNIRNQGVEFTLDQDIIKSRNLSWTATLNFGLNRGKVLSLPDELPEIYGVQYGDVYTSAYVGESTTALSGKDYLRNEDGKIICNTNGYPEVNPNKNELIGNREAKFSAGLVNTINYKSWSLSLLFDGRLGGDVLNVTERGLISNGQSRVLESYRGRQVVVDGVVLQEDGSYEQNTTPITLDNQTIINFFQAVSSNFVEDGSFIRLSYITLGYDFSKFVKNTAFTGLRCSFTGNNLFLLTKYTGSDPATNANVAAKGTGSAGIDNYAVPGTRSFNFSVIASF